MRQSRIEDSRSFEVTDTGDDELERARVAQPDAQDDLPQFNFTVYLVIARSHDYIQDLAEELLHR